jgi:hypothetical protein
MCGGDGLQLHVELSVFDEVCLLGGKNGGGAAERSHED